MSGPHQWSTIPLENQTADARAQFPEGQPASSLNNGTRGMMATAALARDDGLGTLVATMGANNVYALTTNQGLIDPASTNGGGTPKISKAFTLRISFDKALSGVATNAPKIAIDGAAAVPLLLRDGSVPPDGAFTTGIPYEILGDLLVSGTVSRVRILDASGATPGVLYNYTPGAVSIAVPPGATGADVEAFGGGGGSGGVGSAGNGSASGGGAGEFVPFTLSNLKFGDTLAGVIGAGGAAGQAGGYGGDGIATTLTVGGVTYTANAGKGGSPNGIGLGGPGGTGSTLPGHVDGGYGSAGLSSGNGTGGNGGSASRGGPGGGGAPGIGSAGTSPGGGGGGPGSTGANLGAPGAPGGLIIRWKTS
jgi:hypothetical protein